VAESEASAGVEAMPLSFAAAAPAGTGGIVGDAAAAVVLGARAGTIGRSGDPRVDGILSGMRWAETAISYSDPDAASDYPSGYQVDANGNGISAQFESLSRLSPAQLRTVHAALDARPDAAAGFSVEGLTNLGIAYAAPGSGRGTIRVANSGDAATAYGLYPSGDNRGGDAFFNAVGRAPVVGNFDHTAILHELGHTLGLDHGHTADHFGALPRAWDSFEFSVMTYRTAVGNPAAGIRSEAWGNPQSYMMLDIRALQYLYGADYTTNAGATRYSWDPATGRTFIDGALALAPGANRILLTIWDGGGYDTYNLSNYSTAA
jgi:serralysin